VSVGIRNPKDFWSGVIFVAVGVAAVVLGRDHPMGTAMRMGPAYFPIVLGLLLALIGLATILRALVRSGPPVEKFTFGKPALVLGSNVLFGLFLRPLGLVVALVALVLVSAYASQRFRWPAALALAAGLAISSAIAFVRLLGLPIPILGSWLGG
jgi:putative tricarboxylic transport membrane protein